MAALSLTLACGRAAAAVLLALALTLLAGQPAAAGKLPDFRGRDVRVFTFNCPPFSIIDNGTFDGVEMKAFLEIARLLNLKPKWMHPTDPYNPYGNIQPNGSWMGGALGSLEARKAEVAFCALWMTGSFGYKTARPVLRYCYTFLAPRPGPEQGAAWMRVIRPFTGTLWLVLIVAVMFSGRVYRGLATLASRVGAGPHFAPVDNTQSMLAMVGGLVATYFPDLGPDRWPLRHFMNWWSIFGLYMVTGYGSSLLSHLTAPQFEPPINTVKELVQAGFYWGIHIEVTPIFDLNDKWHRILHGRLQKETSPEDRLRHIKDPKFSMYCSRINGMFTNEGYDVPTEFFLNNRVIKECLSYFYSSFAFENDSPLRKPFDTILHWMESTGLFQYWMRDVVRRRSDPAFQTVTMDTAPGATTDLRPLEPLDVVGAYLILSAGLGLATIVFIGELAVKKLADRRRNTRKLWANLIHKKNPR